MNDDELLEDLLQRWADARDRGELISAEQLARDRPDLVPIVARRIEAILAVKAFEPSTFGGGFAKAVRRPPRPALINGRYRLQCKLGGGSAGEVWQAHDEVIGRDVAIKLPLRRDVDLLAEAKLVAELKHPNILMVLDAGEQEGVGTYIVTLLMPGRTLADRIEDAGGPLPVKKVLGWVEQIADALETVHRAGIAHRDVKPGNILLDEQDRAVLADFGIAIDLADQQPGTSTGTLLYKSPEQLAGRRLDARSDVYSLAMATHRMLAAEFPYGGAKDESAIRQAIAAGVTDKLSSRIPARLRPVISRALSREPSRRYESAPLFAQTLAAAWWWTRFGRSLAMTAAVLCALIAVPVIRRSWRIREDHRRAVEASTRQTDEAARAVRDVMRLKDETLRRIDDVRALEKQIIDQTMNDPFHRARRAESEARRKAGAAGKD